MTRYQALTSQKDQLGLTSRFNFRTVQHSDFRLPRSKFDRICSNPYSLVMLELPVEQADSFVTW